MKTLYNRIKTQVALFALWLSAIMLALRNGLRLRQLWADCRGDGSMNFLITVVISVAIAAILIGVISNAIPGFWDTVQERITGLLGA